MIVYNVQSLFSSPIYIHIPCHRERINSWNLHQIKSAGHLENFESARGSSSGSTVVKSLNSLNVILMQILSLPTFNGGKHDSALN